MLDEDRRAWLDELALCFMAMGGMTREDAEKYVGQGDWSEWINDGLSPSDACTDDMSYWEA